ncbi:acetyltransferase, partial [Delitschia confertaspora ATCC 74209]
MTARQWQRFIADQTFLISTSRDLLSHQFVQESFGDEAMYWANPMSPEALKLMLDNSCTLGLYKVERREAMEEQDQQQQQQQRQYIPIGLARLVTDYVTFAYLTDVFVREEFRKFGLGKWLIVCCREVLEGMPELRRAMLMTSVGYAKNMYQRELGMKSYGQDPNGLTVMCAKKA